MLRLVCVLILLFVTPWSTWAAELPNPARTLPKLVVVIVIDLLGIETPSSSTGRVLTEMLAAADPVPAAAKK